MSKTAFFLKMKNLAEILELKRFMLDVQFSKVEFDLREPSKPAKQRRMRIYSLKSDLRVITDCKILNFFLVIFDLKNLQYIYALKQPK